MKKLRATYRLLVVLAFFLGLVVGWTDWSGWYEMWHAAPQKIVEPSPFQTNRPPEPTKKDGWSMVESVRLVTTNGHIYTALDDHLRCAALLSSTVVLSFTTCPLKANNLFWDNYTPCYVTVTWQSVGDWEHRQSKMVAVEPGVRVSILLSIPATDFLEIELQDDRGHSLLDADRLEEDLRKGQYIHSVWWLSKYAWFKPDS